MQNICKQWNFIYGTDFNEILRKYWTRELKINTSAIYCCILSLIKGMDKLEQAIENLNCTDNDSHRKKFVYHSCGLYRLVSNILFCRSCPLEIKKNHVTLKN